MHLYLIAATDPPKITDWVSAVAAGLGVLATIGIGIAVAVYANGYRMRVRAHRDPLEQIRVSAFNSGRIRGEVGPVALIVRLPVGLRMLRWCCGKNKLEPILAKAVPAEPQPIEPGRTEDWYIRVPDLTNTPYLAPSWRRPLHDREQHNWVKPRRVRLRVERSLYCPRYLRFREINRLNNPLNPPTDAKAIPQRELSKAEPTIHHAVRSGDHCEVKPQQNYRLAIVMAIVGFMLGRFGRRG
jgi:hypothetical protein